MKNFTPSSVDYAWISQNSDNPWGFLQSTQDQLLFFFYFDQSTLEVTN
jgi:hypothetical protein